MGQREVPTMCSGIGKEDLEYFSCKGLNTPPHKPSERDGKNKLGNPGFVQQWLLTGLGETSGIAVSG